MNSRIKGNKSVNRAKEYYTEDGWLIDSVEKTGKWLKNKDLFSSDDIDGFDLCGVKKNKTIFVQVKTNTPPTQKTYIAFAQAYGGENVFVEAYTWYDRVGPVIHKFLPNGTVTKLDLRK